MDSRKKTSIPDIEKLIEYFWQTRTGKISQAALIVLLTVLVILLLSITWTAVSLAIALAVLAIVLIVLLDKALRNRVMELFRSIMLDVTRSWVKKNLLPFREVRLARAKQTHQQLSQRLATSETIRDNLKQRVAASDREVQNLIEQIRTEHAAGNTGLARTLVIRVSGKKTSNVRLKKSLLEQEARVERTREIHEKVGCDIEQQQADNEMYRLRLLENDGDITGLGADDAELAELYRLSDDEMEDRLNHESARLDLADIDSEAKFANLSVDAALAEILGDAGSDAPKRISQSDFSSASAEVEEENEESRRFNDLLGR